MNYNIAGMGAGDWGVNALTFTPLFMLFLVWSIFWKGLALWHSARRCQNWWFLILLVINTAGILEIIYLFAVAKLKFGLLFSKVSASGNSETSA